MVQGSGRECVVGESTPVSKGQRAQKGISPQSHRVAEIGKSRGKLLWIQDEAVEGFDVNGDTGFGKKFDESLLGFL